jgi:hypothetical protein
VLAQQRPALQLLPPLRRQTALWAICDAEQRAGKQE